MFSSFPLKPQWGLSRAFLTYRIEIPKVPDDVTWFYIHLNLSQFLSDSTVAYLVVKIWYTYRGHCMAIF